jgi:hypothetical protein
VTDRPDDHEIREHFARLRSETEAGSVPDFRALLDRARARDVVPLPRRGSGRVFWAGGLAGAAVAAALAALLLTRERPDPDAEFERLVSAYASDATAWRSPTDALLDVPGSGLVRSLPSVGETLGEGL